MTERLYYGDSFLREFDAQALACEPAGERWHVSLDRTAFYPTSGGQPNDTGRLGDAAVVDVIDREDGAIVHVTDRPVATGLAHGVIDWERRFEHMQQHTAQHLLSAAFVRIFNFPTVSFHLGRAISTIDIAAPSIVPRHLEEAERLVNQVIMEDRPIAVSFATAAQLAQAGIRKAVDREGPLRVVEVEGFDRQPCGGTHLTRTGQAGLLLIRKCEKQKQNWRIEFVAGFRALDAARSDHAALSSLTQELSCGIPDLLATLRKALDERRAGQRTSKHLYERLAKFEAPSLLAKAAPDADGTRRVVAVLDGAEAEYLGLLAAELVAQPPVQVLLASRAGGAVVFAQSQGLPANMGALLRDLLTAAGGKGGGSQAFARGSVPNGVAVERILALAIERLRE